MKLLILGHRGRIGQRWHRVFEHLDVDVVGWDSAGQTSGNGPVTPRPALSDFDKVLIATPTNTHVDMVRECIANAKDFLVEKPLCKDIHAAELLAEEADTANVDGRIVCNWAYVLPWKLYPRTCDTIRYSNFCAGDDGLVWDCCQLIYLARQGCCTLNNRAPIFDTRINGFPVTLTDIDRSYVAMAKAWIRDPNELWDLHDASQMARHCKETEKCLNS